MRTFRRSGCILSLCSLCCCMRGVFTVAISQEILHTISAPSSDSLQISSLSFDRILNTYLWNGIFQKEIHGPVWDVDIRQVLRSRLIKTNQTAAQDEYQGLIALRARLKEKWNLQFRNASNVLADSRATDLGRMAQHQVLAGFEYLPLENLTGEASGGYEVNSQEEESDHGFAYAFGLDARRMKLEDFHVSLRSSWNQSLLGRRSPRTGDAQAVLIRDFGFGIEDSLAVSYSTQRREFFTTLSSASQSMLGVQHNIYQRDASNVDIINRTKYSMGESLSLIVLGGFSNRLIDRGYRFQDPASLVLDSRIQEMQYFGSLSLQWTALDWFAAHIRLSYQEKDERHSVKDDVLIPDSVYEHQRGSANRLENTAQRTMMSVGLTSEVAQNDNIRLVSSVGILRYDTPDLLNTDDRDELLVTSGIEFVHLFSKDFFLAVNADLTLFHMVYLDRDQSANNNWNRVLRFSPSIDYAPTSWFHTVARTEVLANYTVSDYEQQVASIRSFSFRQALWSDSTMIQLSKRIQCNYSGSLRIFERGTLRWKEFKEKPEEYYIEKTFWPEFIWSSEMGLKVGIGYRYFGQDRYTYEGDQRMFVQGIEALGPTAMVEWSSTGSERVRIVGWREEQKTNGKTTLTISNLSVQVGFNL